MSSLNLTRPDKLLKQGLKTLSSVRYNLYSDQKTEAKAKAKLTFIGEKKVEEVKVQLYEYDLESLKRIEKVSTFDFLKDRGTGKSYWLNFHGIHDVKLIQMLGESMGLERLTLRQIIDTTQRPKVEEYEHYLFFSVKSILKQDAGEMQVEQLSFVLGQHFIISFQEEEGDHFEGIRNKLSEGLGFIQSRKSDYLLVQLLDAILDNYFETIDQVNFEIAALEKTLFQNPGKSTLIYLEGHKRSAQLIKKSLGPMKEAIFNILNGRSQLVKKENLKFFKELANSATSAIEEIDTTLRTLESLTNIYFASLSQKMNETMKVLTTVATIFIPLTFIAGIYGMNFENMPELGYQYGYPITLGAMSIIFVGMLIYFRKKKWV